MNEGWVEGNIVYYRDLEKLEEQQKRVVLRDRMRVF